MGLPGIAAAGAAAIIRRQFGVDENAAGNRGVFLSSGVSDCPSHQLPSRRGYGAPVASTRKAIRGGSKIRGPRGRSRAPE